MKITKLLRINVFLAASAAVLLTFPACKKKGSDPESAAAAAAEAVAKSKPAVELDPSSFNAQRAQAFGFLSRMPATTEGAIGIRNFSDVLASLLTSNTYKRATAMALEFGENFDPQQVQMVQAMVDQYVGKELFMIFSGGSGEQLERISFISNLISDLNMQNAGFTAAGLGQQGGAEMMETMLNELRKGLKDGNSDLSNALEKLQFPPIILGSKVSDGADEVIASLNELAGQLPPGFTVSNTTVGGGEFTSWKLVLQDVITEAQVATFNEFLKDEQASNRLAEILRKKTIEFSFGKIDNYLVFALGSDKRHLDFVSKPEESILAAKAFGFGDPFLSKKLVGYSFLSNAILASGTSGGQFQRMANSFSAGLVNGDAEMKKLGGLVQQLAGHMDKLTKRGSQTHVGVTYMENGLHGESVGGYTSELIDWQAKSQFANSAPADAAMVFSSVANPKYRGESIAMLETVFSIVDTGSNIWAKNTANQQVAGMKAMFGGDLSKVWGIMKGKVLDGLGSQSGVIVDLAGSMPKIPNVPRVVQNEGKAPRIAIASDVKDREKLAAAWDELVPAVNEGLMKIPDQQEGAEVQLPDTISDEGDDIATHFFPAPFLSNDFLPSVSVNDDLFYLSTSKNFSQALAAAAKKPAGEVRGMYMMVDFAKVQRFAEDWIQLALRNSDTMFPDESQALEFQQTAAQLQALMEFTRGIRSLKANRYQEESGAMRSSWHFEIEDIGEEVD